MLTPVNFLPDSKSTKEKILSAACDLFIVHGSEGISMRKIAQNAAISPTAIYRHFANKDELYKQILVDGFQTFASYLYPARQGKNPLERLDLAAEGFYRFATEQPRYYELLFLTMEHSGEERVRKMLRREAATTYEFMVERVQECMDNGDLKQDDAEEIATLLLAVSNGFFGLYVSKTFEAQEPEMKKKYLRNYRRMLEGLKR